MPDFLKDYEPVEDRLRAFWSDHPTGRIETDLLEHVGDSFVVKARVWTENDGTVSATGLAFERETDRGVNATSALENCETSAIGRALANLGYAAKGKRPSREEMSKVSVATSGKLAADIGGGGAQDPLTAPAPSTYPVDPAKCSHKYPSGNWLPWDEHDRCPKCGTPKLVVLEGTTEDLGPA